jgi:hypothetical protein
VLPLLISLALSAGPCPAKPGELRVRLGQSTQKLVTIPGLRGTALIGVPTVVGVKWIGENQLLISGAGVGNATITTFGTEGRKELFVEVSNYDRGCGIFEIDKIIPCDSQIKVRMVGDRIYLEGHADTYEDWKAVRKLKTYGNVISFVKLNPRFADRAVHDANLALLKAGFERVRIVVAGTRAILEGDVPEGNERRIRALATPWLVWIDSLLSPEAPEPSWMPAEIGPESDQAPAAAVTQTAAAN